MYEYDTAGQESVDALGGSTHTYPSRTYITVTNTRCGYKIDWTPIEGREEGSEACITPAGRVLQALITNHKFFQQANNKTYDCPDSSVALPAKPRAGQSSSFTCTGSDGEVQLVVTVAAIDQQLTVNGRTVSTTKLTFDGNISGSTVGTVKETRWYTDGGLLVRWKTKTDASVTTPSGKTNYQEQTNLMLNNLTPQQ
ncbi:MAG: hypothetical protein LC789_14375 [Actinobacteria bacterium]|nr:hypothetical protein [Actinomycetota bacterium]